LAQVTRAPCGLWTDIAYRASNCTTAGKKVVKKLRV